VVDVIPNKVDVVIVGFFQQLFLHVLLVVLMKISLESVSPLECYIDLVIEVQRTLLLRSQLEEEVFI
jgi:hypothetical protein